MKKNTQKILLSTANNQDQIQPVAIDLLHQLVVPDLSWSGFRSLLQLMKRRGQINIQGGQVYSLTNGWQELIRQIPSLNSNWDMWQGDWSCLVFLSAPKADQRFRYLRKFCLNHRCLPLTRGVYLAPSWYLNSILPDLEGIYRHSIQIIKVKDWQGGDMQSRIIEHYDVMGLRDLYSGISKEYSSLLDNIGLQKRLNKQQIKPLQSFFERSYLLLIQDLGLVRYYTQSPITPISLVQNWQHLLSSLMKTRWS